MQRKGLGVGLGKGYYNIVPIDPFIHSLSARGVKTKISPVRYYDLVEIEFKDGSIGHIPSPLFKKNKYGKKFLKNLMKKEIKNKYRVIRDASFFRCPLCDKESYFSGICSDCFDVLHNPESYNVEYVEDLKKAYNKYKKQKTKMNRKKRYYLKRVFSGKVPKLNTKYIFQDY